MIPFPTLNHSTALFCPTLDHRAQTVEARLWWTGWEPQQHQRRHVHAETLREVSYRSAQSDMTHYCCSATRARVSARARAHARHPLPACARALPHLHQIWLDNGLFIAAGHDKTNIDFYISRLESMHSDIFFFFFFVCLLLDGVCKSGTVCGSKPGSCVCANAFHERIAYGPEWNCDETALICSIYQVELITCLVPWNQLCNKLCPPSPAGGLKRILKL